MIISQGYERLVDCEVPESPGMKVGLRISAYSHERDAYSVLLIRWGDGAPLSKVEEWIEREKIGYRYDLSQARSSTRGSST